MTEPRRVKIQFRAKSDLSVISETVDLTDYEIDEFDDLPPDFCRNRCDKQSHAFVNKVVESAFFNGLLSATIMINILFLVFEAIIPDDTKNASSSSRTADGLKVFFQGNHREHKHSKMIDFNIFD